MSPIPHTHTHTHMRIHTHVHPHTHTHAHAHTYTHTIFTYIHMSAQEGAMMRDVILAIRADEAHHRLVNHTLSNMKPHDTNPYKPGK